MHTHGKISRCTLREKEKKGRYVYQKKTTSTPSRTKICIGKALALGREVWLEYTLDIESGRPKRFSTVDYSCPEQHNVKNYGRREGGREARVKALYEGIRLWYMVYKKQIVQERYLPSTYSTFFDISQSGSTLNLFCFFFCTCLSTLWDASGTLSSSPVVALFLFS